MRQSTVLIAQLTTAGARAPVAHLVDEVFVRLSRELENQGLSQAVVADLFGLALRTYQRRVQRLRDAAADETHMRWHAVLELLQENSPCTRSQIWAHFPHDAPAALMAVLKDLVDCGLVSREGNGASTKYAANSGETLQFQAEQARENTAKMLVWLDVCHHPGCQTTEISRRTQISPELVERTIERLISQDKLRVDKHGSLDATVAATNTSDVEHGWEASVFDHFQSVVGVICARVRGAIDGHQREDVGGTTFSFDVWPGHKHAEEVKSLLLETRGRLQELWEKVEAQNDIVPVPEGKRERVVFYFGQQIKDESEEL